MKRKDAIVQLMKNSLVILFAISYGTAAAWASDQCVSAHWEGTLQTEIAVFMVMLCLGNMLAMIYVALRTVADSFRLTQKLVK